MSKMFVIDAERVTYYPDGIYQPASSRVRRARFSDVFWLSHHAVTAILVDLGTGPDWKHAGEFQMWGRDHRADHPFFNRELWREWTYPKLTGRIQRWMWERYARRIDKLIEANP
jgi:hypothetical protein